MINAPHSCGSSPSLRQLIPLMPAIIVNIERGIESKFEMKMKSTTMCEQGLCTRLHC
jgi:hypothetical protein